MQALFEKGVGEFNRGCFFEAHDTWEDLWMETRGSHRLFYQGLIQVAVGMYHLGNGNYRGAGSQLGKALDKLEGYLPTYHGIETRRLVDHLRECLSEVQCLQEGTSTAWDERKNPSLDYVPS